MHHETRSVDEASTTARARKENMKNLRVEGSGVAYCARASRGFKDPRASSIAILVALVALFTGGVFVTDTDAAETSSVSSTHDTKIVENYPTKNYGNATSLSVDGDTSHLSSGSGKDEAALIKWDVSGIASGTKISSASITLTVTNGSPQTYEVYKLKRAWAESGATWKARYASGTPWEVAGAKGSFDRETTVAGTITPKATGKQTFTISPDVVQGWVNDPASNQGIIIADAANADGFSFYSGESATSSQRPQLTINLGGSGGSVLVGAGDIAGGNNDNDEATAALIRDIPGTVFTAGDNAYNGGTLEEYKSYYEPTWGTEKARTKPSPGNHEYIGGTTKQYGAGYFDYFGSVAAESNGGSYSYELGDWHVISLNTGQCYGSPEADGSIPRCGPGDPMLTWLESDLEANQKPCTVAYFHHPRFTSGSVHGSQPAYTRAIWDTLYAYNADVVVSGDEHLYERFAPQDPGGKADPQRGIRQFVVGTGGRSLYEFGTVIANSEVRNSDTFGVIKLTLRSGGYDWEFVPVAGKTFTDSGSDSCH